nr:response regulator [Bacteriovorax sp. HI3]
MSIVPILLIVDDNSDLLEMYEEILQIPGVKTVGIDSGASALEFCKNNHGVQVIISDSNMGEMSGMELLSNLRSYYQTMPVFYLFTGAFDIREEEVKEAGGHGLILKPFDLDEILERIKKDIKF